MERRGAPFFDPGLRIDYIAICHGLIIITGDTRHFSKSLDLRLKIGYMGKTGVKKILDRHIPF